MLINKNFRFRKPVHKNFRENQNFSRKCLNSKQFRINLNENSHFQKHFHEIFSKIGNFRKRYIVQTLSCPGCPVQVTHTRPVSVALYQLSGSRCPVLIHLSCPCCPVLAVLLFQVPCPSHSGHCSPDTTVRLSGPDSPVISVLSRLICPGCL